MHERSLLADLIQKLEEIARANPQSRLAEVRVRLGAWSHMTADHFAEHFREMTVGTPAEGAHLDVVVGDPDDPLAQNIVLESVELES